MALKNSQLARKPSGMATLQAIGNAAVRFQKMKKAYDVGKKLGTRLKYRGNGSKTQTKRKYSRGSRMPRGGHNDQTSSSFTLVIRKQPLKNCSNSRFKLVETYQQIIQGVEGRQAVDTSRYMGASTPFVSSSGTTANVRTASPTAYFNLNGNQLSTGQVSGPFSSGTTTSQIQYMNVHTCFSDMNVTNLQSAAVTVYVYFMKAKHTTGLDPLEWWDRDLDNLDYGQPANIARAVTTNTTWQLGGTRSTSLGNYPNTPGLLKQYTVMRVKKLELDGGASHRIRFNTIYNRRVDRQDFQRLTDQNTPYVGGFTIIPLIICKGSPVGINDTAASTTASEMTTSTTKVGVTLSRHWTFSTLKEPPQLPCKFTIQGLVAGTTHVFGPSLIDDEDQATTVKRV